MQICAWYVEGMIKNNFTKYYRRVFDEMIRYQGGSILVHKSLKNKFWHMVCSRINKLNFKTYYRYVYKKMIDYEGCLL